MAFSRTPKLGLTSYADLIDLMGQHPDWFDRQPHFSPEITTALGYELSPPPLDKTSTSDELSPDPVDPAGIPENSDPTVEPVATQFHPAPTCYWRVTRFLSLADRVPETRRRRRRKKDRSAGDLGHIRQAFGFSLANALPREPLAPLNAITTQLRRAASTSRSRHELDLAAAVERLSRGQFLFQVPKRPRRVWGHELLCLEDRATRLTPYWLDQDDVTLALSRLYPDSGFTLARMFAGRRQFQILHPPASSGQAAPLPPSGTLVLALSDLGGLVSTTRDASEYDQWKRFWRELGRRYQENGNRAVALVPCRPELISPEVARYWQILPWGPVTRGKYPVEDHAAWEQLLTMLSAANRLEPELLRAIRKLLPETRDDPGWESRVWQSPLVASPHSTAADLDTNERNKWFPHQFGQQPQSLREEVLSLMRRARQNGLEDVWVGELLGLDGDSQRLIPARDLELAERQILSLAEPGNRAQLDDYARWLSRLGKQLTSLPEMDESVRKALAHIVQQLQGRNEGVVAPWMPSRVTPQPTFPELRFQLEQRGDRFLLREATEFASSGDSQVKVTAAQTGWGKKSGERGIRSERIGSSRPGSLLGEIRSKSLEFRIQEHEGDRAEFAAQRFWQSGNSPAWVHQFGIDEFGPWCSFVIEEIESFLRWIPAGSFLMGSAETEEGRQPNEGPQHEVTISPGFWMGETLCTQEIWSAVMGNYPSRFSGPQRPVENVSWERVQRFFKQINQNFQGISFQLPTEAQWEYACRGPQGKHQRASRYGDLDEVAWYQGNSGDQTHDVRGKKPNRYGLFDLLGNVCEWCQDWSFRPYDLKPRTNPVYAHKVKRSLGRMIRGGSWGDEAKEIRAANRRDNEIQSVRSQVGFRWILPVEVGATPRSDLLTVGVDLTSITETVRTRTRSSITLAPRSARWMQWTETASARELRIPPTRKISLESDCEVLYLELAPMPTWGVESGRDSYGLWCDLEVNSCRQRLRWIPPGQFLMGSPETESGRDSDEVQHPVTITTGFWLFDTPCTQGLWLAVMGGENPSRFTDLDRPVEQVSWDDSIAFARKLSARMGIHFGLPSEAQWEYACRAGSTTAIYTGDLEILGDGNAPALDPIAWYGGNSGHEYDHADGAPITWLDDKQYSFEKGGTRRVKGKRPNRWGLYDMLGNVWEWCSDWNGDYAVEAQVDPMGPENGSGRVLRGGSWFSGARSVRSAYRYWSAPGVRSGSLGFRLLSSGRPVQCIPPNERVASRTEPRDEAVEKQRTE
jgi:formylglycine-generating enzyme required for sulfatase activity